MGQKFGGVIFNIRGKGLGPSLERFERGTNATAAGALKRAPACALSRFAELEFRRVEQTHDGGAGRELLSPELPLTTTC